jgi:hypothetical protein
MILLVKKHQKQLDDQAKANRDERKALIDQQNKNAEEVPDMRNKVKWMAEKMNEKKKVIGLSIAVGMLVVALIVISIGGFNYGIIH